MSDEDLCQCKIFSAFADRYPDLFTRDEEHRVYRFTTSDGTLMIRYCPTCGGKLFNDRVSMSDLVDPTELEAAKQMALKIKSVQDGIQILGDPIQLEDNPIPGHLKAAVFRNGWKTLELCVSDMADGSCQRSIRPTQFP